MEGEEFPWVTVPNHKPAVNAYLAAVESKHLPSPQLFTAILFTLTSTYHLRQFNKSFNAQQSRLQSIEPYFPAETGR
jgi:hypothetical protein